jgi:fluoroacetyl-CoA thioesterase
MGITGESERVVTAEMAPEHLRQIVLSTPFMIALIEGVCLDSVASHLDEDETTVGTHVCVSHESAVLEGETFFIRSILTSIDRRRLNFDIEVDGPRGPVSRGTHQRAVIKTK